MFSNRRCTSGCNARTYQRLNRGVSGGDLLDSQGLGRTNIKMAMLSDVTNRSVSLELHLIHSL